MKTSTTKVVDANIDLASFAGRLVSFNNSLKLFHWHVTGEASYAQHIALDQAIEALTDATDRLVETSYALRGDLNIVVPETATPNDIIKHAEEFFDYTESERKLFDHAFSQAIIDDYQEAIQQLLYRLKRLK